MPSGDNSEKPAGECPNHADIERRLRRGEEQFDSILGELKENNRLLTELNTNMSNQQQDVDALKKDVWGRNGNDGLTNEVSSLKTAIRVTLLILFSGGGIWLLISALLKVQG